MGVYASMNKLLSFFSETTRQIRTKLCLKDPWVEKIKSEIDILVHGQMTIPKAKQNLEN